MKSIASLCACLCAATVSFGESAPPLEGAAAGAGGLATSPYGVCAHLHLVKSPAERADESRRIAAAGIGRVRFDFLWRDIQKEPDGPFDFSHYDEVMADAEGAGLTVLPIIYGNPVPKWADPIWEHLPEWGRFVEAVVARYGASFPDVEVWNEQNLENFWHHPRDPARYAEVLRAACEAAKRANPCVRVLFGGAAGVPLDYIEGVYKAGGGPFFDAMCVHPYNHPRPPEGDLDKKLENLRALMAKYGDAEKPVVITEHGWPTHDERIPGLGVLRPGLAVARPEMKTWRAVYATTTGAAGDGANRLDPVAEALEAALPPGSTLEVCFGARLRERLAAGDVDLVVYPFDETFPIDTFDAVSAFVKAGGTLAMLGGMPMWTPMRETATGVFAPASDDMTGASTQEMREALRIGAAAWWTDSALPRKGRAFPTLAAKAAGFKGDPAGEPGNFRFQTPRLLREGDEFIPLLVAKDENGDEATVASVARLAGGTQGCLVVSGIMNLVGRVGSAGEEGQARYLPRALSICLAEGVEQYFWYEFRSPERDPQYSEHHFGLAHVNFTPKPALGSYSNFILARPPGSVQTPGPWHDEKREFFFPQWTRPDGTPAGILWKTGATERMALRFEAEKIRFRSYTGRTIVPARDASGAYLLPVGEDPIYFEGGALAQPE